MSQFYKTAFDPDALEKAKIGVLVVEDDLSVAQLVDVALRGLGIVRISHAENGRDGLKQYVRNSPDFNLIISDWEMPKMTGFELLQEIRAIDPDLPFLMLTARAQEHAVLSAMDAEVTNYITKPISPTILLQKLDAMLAYTREQMAAHR
ncbi:MAG: response regulator [Alphaproteobacteria bacterium]|nr:response regulator [Alphaproteobacteria bacterium]